MKKTLSLMLAALFCFAFTAAALGEGQIYCSDTITYDYEDGFPIVVDHKLEILDEKNAVWTTHSRQEGYYDNVSSVWGTYIVTDEEIVFSEKNTADIDNGTYTLFTVRDGKIAEEPYTTWIEPGTMLAVGVSEGYGESAGATLNVRSYNRAELTLPDGTVYTGTISMYGDGWDLFAETGSGDWCDLFVVFNEKGEFLATSFGETPVYSVAAGTYTLFGDLGEIKLTVGEDGNSTALVPWQGTKVYLSGTPYTGSTDDLPGGVYLCDDFGLALDLTITQMSDGTLNYQGTLISPLGAG